MITEKDVLELAKTRPDMACIFQTLLYTYPRFLVYKTYVACYNLNQISSYNTTELRDDIINLEKGDTDLNKKLKDLGFDPEDNVIYTFYLENQSR